MTQNSLRKNGLWVISASSVVQRTIFRCVTCRKLRGAFRHQKMADLPKNRCIEAPLFTHLEWICLNLLVSEKEYHQDLQTWVVYGNVKCV